MKSTDALLRAWDETVGRRGDEAAIFDTARQTLRTFRQIQSDAVRLGETVLEPFQSGDIVAFQIGNHADWPALFLAALARAVIVLPLEQTISESEREIALTICHASGLIAASSFGELKVEKHVGTAVAWDGPTPSLLKLTSGTTAAPRAVRFRSDQLLADCRQICASMGIESSDVNFGVVPVSHSYGLSNLVTPLIANGVSLVLSRDRLPRAVLNDLARSRATVFAGMPVFYQAFCEIAESCSLPDLRLCISAGAPLTAALARRFYERFERPIHSFYGSSECGGICYDRDGTVFAEGYVGEPLQNVEVDFVGGPEQPGQIRVRSAAVSDGYFPEPNEEKLGQGSFRPDDLLERNGSGFCIVGRVSDLINVAGKKVAPAQVEEVLLKFEGVRASVVFGRRSAQRNEEVAACVVGKDGLVEADLLEFCRRHLSGWQVPKRIFLVDSIPANERGKVSRKELAKRFAA